MGYTNFPNGITSFGMPVFGGGFEVGPGKVFRLVTARDATDKYYETLRENGVSETTIFTSLSAAYDAMRSGYGDTLLVYPGNHIQTASLTWDKDDTRIIGMGMPNQLVGTTTPVAGSVAISTTTTGVASLIKITAHHVYVQGIQTINNGANTGNYCDIMLGAGSRNCFFAGCGFRGGNNTTQTQNATAGIPLWIAAEAAAGNGTKFSNCWIGSSGNAARTKGPGCIYFESGAAKGLNFEFENCRLATRIETENADSVCLVHLAGNYAVDRYLLFKDTLFYNFWNNHTSQLDFAIVDACGTSKDVIFQNCALIGIDAWSNAHSGTNSLWSVNANGGSDGGKGVAVDVAA